MTQHTPGPWRYHWALPQEIRIGWIKEHGEKPRTSPAEFLDSDGHNLVIARLPLDRKSDEPTEEMKANARLIASAPVLDDLVRRVIRAIDDSTIENVDGASGINPESFFEHDGLSNWLPEARAAIVKATGESQ